MIRRLSAIAALSIVLAWPGLVAAQEDGGDTRPTLGLMGTLPIYWGEAEGLGDLLVAEEPAHWVRRQLEQDYRLLPMDWLDAAALDSLNRLMLAQPRALSPEENVALDDWVRGGGQLLLFADPMLTGESRFAIGDRRRPQDVVLLSPILDYWGLGLEYLDDQPLELRYLDIAGTSVPVRLAGRLVQRGTARDCAIDAAGLVARCDIGAGSALIVADAALLDLYHTAAAAAPALAVLLRQAFPKIGGNAGNPAQRKNFHNFQLDNDLQQGHIPPESEKDP